MQGIYSSPFTTKWLTSLKSATVLPHISVEPQLHPSQEVSVVGPVLWLTRLHPKYFLIFHYICYLWTLPNYLDAIYRNICASLNQNWEGGVGCVCVIPHYGSKNNQKVLKCWHYKPTAMKIFKQKWTLHQNAAVLHFIAVTKSTWEKKQHVNTWLILWLCPYSEKQLARYSSNSCLISFWVCISHLSVPTCVMDIYWTFFFSFFLFSMWPEWSGRNMAWKVRSNLPLLTAGQMPEFTGFLQASIFK